VVAVGGGYCGWVVIRLEGGLGGGHGHQGREGGRPGVGQGGEGVVVVVVVRHKSSGMVVVAMCEL
jgi:hypothetical protein